MSEYIALTETTYYILLSLYRPLHGYGIMQRTAELSGGRVKLAAGTLYGALNAMVERGWIALLPGEGQEVLKKELERLRELVANGDMVMKGEV